MAEKPIKTPLPADLPENWNAGQTVAPDGPAVGLSEQHGYNYLMAAVNRAHRGINEVNDAFETVSGKRTCRFVVGTSKAGWTAADCDFLCDGTDDQVEINLALSQKFKSLGTEVVILDGNYYLSGVVEVPLNCVLRGNGDGTWLFRAEDAEGGAECNQIITSRGFLRDLQISGYVYDADSYFIYLRDGVVSNIHFGGSSAGIYVNATYEATISHCNADVIHSPFVFVNSARSLVVENNYIGLHPSEVSLETAVSCTLYFRGNIGPQGCGTILLKSLGGGSIIEGNSLGHLEIEKNNNAAGVIGSLVIGNIFSTNEHPDKMGPAIVLGEGSGGNFVVGNMLLRPSNNVNHAIQDLGTNNIVRFNSNDPGGSTPATVQQATPAITVSPDGRITAAANQQAGYVAAGTKSASVTLSAAQDADFTPENIREGVTIFGVEGTLRSGGSSSGVESFNGRAGAVVPQDGDYTARQVGAIPATEAVGAVQVLTQAEYDGLSAKDAATLYLIKE